MLHWISFSPNVIHESIWTTLTIFHIIIFIVFVCLLWITSKRNSLFHFIFFFPEFHCVCVRGGEVSGVWAAKFLWQLSCSTLSSSCMPILSPFQSPFQPYRFLFLFAWNIRSSFYETVRAINLMNDFKSIQKSIVLLDILRFSPFVISGCSEWKIDQISKLIRKRSNASNWFISN